MPPQLPPTPSPPPFPVPGMTCMRAHAPLTTVASLSYGGGSGLRNGRLSPTPAAAAAAATAAAVVPLPESLADSDLDWKECLRGSIVRILRGSLVVVVVVGGSACESAVGLSGCAAALLPPPSANIVRRRLTFLSPSLPSAANSPLELRDKLPLEAVLFISPSALLSVRSSPFT